MAISRARIVARLTNFVVGPRTASASRKSFFRPFEYGRTYFAAPESSNRRDVADKVELEIFVKCRVTRVRKSNQQKQ